MKESEKDELKYANKKDKISKENVKLLHEYQAVGVFSDIDDEFVKSDKMIEQLLYPYDVAEVEVPSVVGNAIVESPGTGRFSLDQKMGAIWLMQVLLDENDVPRYKIVKMSVGIGVKALENIWRNRQKWIEYAHNFSNISLKVIKMNFVISLLKASTALKNIDYNRLAKSKDPRDHANLLKLTEGLSNRIALADSLFNAIEATDATLAIEGEVGVLPVAPSPIEVPKKVKDDKNNDLQADKESEEAE